MRYERQKGLVDQKKLAGSKAVIAGVGGLGVPAATYLALAGVGELVLIDDDVVEESNLNRQFLFTESDIGKKKAGAATKKLRKFNPLIKVGVSKLSPDLMRGASVVLDCFDNWGSRQKLWELAFKAGVPVVHGAVDEKFGQIAVFFSRQDARAFAGKREKGCTVIGAAAGVIGSQMALEAIEVIQGNSTPRLLAFDGKLSEFPIRKQKHTHILVRFSEIWLKSRVTRSKMIHLMGANLWKATGVKPHQKGARFIFNFKSDLMETLPYVFGIKSFSPVLRVGLDELEQKFLEFSKCVAGKKFRVTVHRSWKGFPKKSPELERELGAIANDFGKVDLTDYDVNLEVEIHQDNAYLFTNRIKGPGGMPYGSEGRTLALFSGGIDSPVASWLMGRRGAELEFLFLNPLGPVLESRVNEVFESLGKWFPESSLWVIDISSEVKEIESAKEGLRQTLYKRFMYGVAEAAARRLGCHSFVTGESLGQVSSQTLKSLEVIDCAVNVPVFRPLIGFDKDDIIDMAKKIGSFDKSSGISEFCSIESHSNASPNLKDVLFEEKKFLHDYEKISSRIRKAKSVSYDALPADFKDVTVVKLWEKIPKLTSSKRYLFVCKGGHRSAEKAHEARQRGIDAFSLGYREAKKKHLI